MQNYGEVLKAQGIEANSAGLAQQRYAIYQDSVAASTARLTDAWNKLTTTTTNSGLIIWFLNLATAIVDATTAMGGVIPVITGLMSAILIVKSLQLADFFGNIAISAVRAIAPIQALNMTIAGTGVAVSTALGAIGIALSLGYAIYTAYKNAVDQTSASTKTYREQIDELESSISSLNSANSKNQDQIKQLSDLFVQYHALRNAINLTGQDLKDYYDVQNKIKELLPQVAGSYDAEGNFILTEGTNLQGLLKLKQDEIDINNQLIAQQSQKEGKALLNQYQEDAYGLSELKKQLDALNSKGNLNPAELLQKLFLPGAIGDATLKIRQDVIKLAMAYESLDPQMKKVWDDQFVAMGPAGQQILDYINKMEKVPDAINQADQSINTMLPDLTTFDHVLEKSAAALKLLSDALDKEQSSLANLHPTLVTLVSDYQKTGILTDDMIETLKKSFPDNWYKALVEVNGQYQLSIPLLKQLEIATYQKAVADAQAVISQAKLQASLIDSDLATQDQILATEELALAESNGSTSAVEAAMVKIQATSATVNALKAERDALAGNMDAYEAELQQALNALALIKTNAFTPLPDTKAAKAYEDYYNTILKDTEDMLKQQANDRKQALQDQLDGYKKIIDAEKSLLDDKEKELEYQEELADKTLNLSKIDDQLLALQFDNSQEGIAKRLELEDQKAKAVKDINDVERKHSVEEQKAALDKEYEDFKTIIDKKIKDIDDYLKKTGLIEQEAIKLLESHTDSFYQSLITWNDTYNNSIKDLQIAWDGVFNAKQNATSGSEGTSDEDHRSNYSFDPTIVQYRSKSGGKLISPEEWKSLPNYDSGGIVGTFAKSAETSQYAKLLKGEVVATEGQIYSFLHNTLPKFISMGTGMNGNTNISMPIHVAGNLDKNVLPDLKNMVTDTLNKVLNDRGVKRNSFSYSV